MLAPRAIKNYSGLLVLSILFVSQAHTIPASSKDISGTRATFHTLDPQHVLSQPTSTKPGPRLFVRQGPQSQTSGRTESQSSSTIAMPFATSGAAMDASMMNLKNLIEQSEKSGGGAAWDHLNDQTFVANYIRTNNVYYMRFKEDIPGPPKFVLKPTHFQKSLPPSNNTLIRNWHASLILEMEVDDATAVDYFLPPFMLYDFAFYLEIPEGGTNQQKNVLSTFKSQVLQDSPNAQVSAPIKNALNARSNAVGVSNPLQELRQNTMETQGYLAWPKIHPVRRQMLFDYEKLIRSGYLRNAETLKNTLNKAYGKKKPPTDQRLGDMFEKFAIQRYEDVFRRIEQALTIPPDPSLTNAPTSAASTNASTTAFNTPDVSSMPEENEITRAFGAWDHRMTEVIKRYHLGRETEAQVTDWLTSVIRSGLHPFFSAYAFELLRRNNFPERQIGIMQGVVRSETEARNVTAESIPVEQDFDMGRAQEAIQGLGNLYQQGRLTSDGIWQFFKEARAERSMVPSYILRGMIILSGYGVPADLLSVIGTLWGIRLNHPDIELSIMHARLFGTPPRQVGGSS